MVSSSNSSGPMTPLPFWQMLSIFMVQLCEAINVNVLFPFLAFMIEDMGYTGHRLGYYAGGLAAAFCGGQFCSSVLWGMISDRFGRKITIIMGTFGAAAGMLVFGTSHCYAQAIIGRFVGGFLNGNIGVLKSFLTEITDHSNRGQGFAYISVSWALGSMIAPLIGGLLCNPVDKYPSLFSSRGIFAEYPYFLPTLVATIVNLLTALLCLLLMKESRASVPPKAVEMTVLKYSAVGMEEEDMDETNHGHAHGQGDEESAIATSSKREGSGQGSGRKANPSANPSDSSTKSLTSSASADSTSSLSEANLPPSTSSVLRQPVVLMTCCSYGLLAMTYIILDETIPLFLKLSVAEGGLGFNSIEIGSVISLSGGIMLFFSLLVLPYFARKPKQQLFELGVLGGIPSVFGWPVLAILNTRFLEHIHSHTVYFGILWPSLVLICTLKNICATFSFTAVMIQVNHSVSEEYLGAVNGLGQSLAALARAIGPALGGALWSMSSRTHNVFINFIAVAVFISIGGVINRHLPDSLEHKHGTISSVSGSKGTASTVDGEEEEEEEAANPMAIMH